MNEELPQIPEDYKTLDDDALAALISEIEKYVEENAEHVTTADELATIEALSEAHAAAKAVQDERNAEANAITEKAQAAKAQVLGSTSDEENDDAEKQGEGEGGDAKPEGEGDDNEGGDNDDDAKQDGDNAEKKEAVAASAAPKRQPAAIRRKPQPAKKAPLALVAAGTGQSMEFDDLAESLITTARSTKPGESATVATITASGEFDSLPRLSKDSEQNHALIASAVKELTEKANEYVRTSDPKVLEGLVAAGGLCAPLAGYYDRFTVGTADRPITNSLPNFNASRGGIQYQANKTLADIDVSGAGAAVDKRTMAQDAATVDESFAYKTCQVVTCGDDLTAEFQAIYQCLEFGNVLSRTFPEQVQQWNTLAGIAHARAGETALLDGFSAGSKAVTFATGDTGAAREILGALAMAHAGYTSRARMAPGSALTAYAPSWVRELVIADFARTLGSRDLALEALGAWEDAVRRIGYVLTYYLDQETGGNQVFGAQADSAVLVPFPSTTKWYIHAPGTFLYLDGGELDLGVVRDTDTNKRNSFQTFRETFEGIAKVGGEALELTITGTATGAYAAAATSAPY